MHWSLGAFGHILRVKKPPSATLLINEAEFHFKHGTKPPTIPTIINIASKYLLGLYIYSVYARVLHGGAAHSLPFPIQYPACLSRLVTYNASQIPMPVRIHTSTNIIQLWHCLDYSGIQFILCFNVNHYEFHLFICT